MSGPQHPLWCNHRHLPAWPVHSAEIGTVQIGDRTSFEVAVNRWADDRAPVVTVTLAAGEDDTVTDMTPQQAFTLARRLTEAAEILLNTWEPLRGGDRP